MVGDGLCNTRMYRYLDESSNVFIDDRAISVAVGAAPGSVADIDKVPTFYGFANEVCVEICYLGFIQFRQVSHLFFIQNEQTIEQRLPREVVVDILDARTDNINNCGENFTGRVTDELAEIQIS